MKTPLACLALACLPLVAAEVKPVPPPGVPVSDKDRSELEAGLAKLRASIESLRGSTLLPDVQIFHEAVRYALQYNEFFAPEDIVRAKELLRDGQARADLLAQGQSPWTSTPGLVVRGYISRLDQSIQPYGLVVPPTYSSRLPQRWRLDAWFHGRNEKLSEVNFLWDRLHNPGEFTPPNTIVLHLYGRYCNANKLAGEVDLFEALEAVKRQYAIDENRIVMRGFSMGGAACWHIAAHYAGLWAAAAPGAGFSETPEFLKVWAKETLKPSWWEQKLWHLYDATDYAVNFYNCPVVAYNGEIDGQAQAADAMERAMGEEGMKLTRVVGPNTAHRYHPDSKIAI
ncbi:MAG TPA: prolyl oligopeptidase family serine peptidase, partial [Bryobacteraceae bacterium]|nr:prolyl oligopeptidase family serine peptidase [Bryobacteraceae bacterium]